ncbi:unnamed protein product [Parnassius apollo]|uniref:(apollo) hypothetical protein n=1 Tax=Parnassius apollo TaxID=110799 RepID=A0A8S3XYM0_PARAO|nr:unnamed protein product [Parnassius apollo]
MPMKISHVLKDREVRFSSSLSVGPLVPIPISRKSGDYCKETTKADTYNKQEDVRRKRGYHHDRDHGCNCHHGASEENGQKNEAAQKEATKKTPEEIPDKGVHGSATTLKPKGVSRRARSMKTTSSSARRRELEAREELARMKLKQAQAAAKITRVRLELAQCEEEDSVDEDQEDRTAQVQNWIETSVLEFRWYDFTAATEEGEFSDLAMVSKFLNIEADKSEAFVTSKEKSGFRRTHRQATHSTRKKDFKGRDSRQST